jgi:hypothetical protein
MLWYKGWLETRLRLAIALGVMSFFLAFQYTHAAGIGKRSASALIPAICSIIAIFACAILAGAGIATQSTFRATKGLHGSILFTLSMPVSRLRLLAVRASIGWMESIAVMGLACFAIWLMTPVLRASVTATEMLEYAATLFACSLAIYLFSVLLATFLDEQWRILATLLAFFVLVLESSSNHIPPSFDLVRAMREGSPLIAHTMPWAAISASVGLGAIFFFAALKIAQFREY